MSEAVFRDDPYARSCEATVTAVDARGIRLDRTVFYPTGGGQPGDRGVLRLEDGGEVPIVDTVKGEARDEIVHVPAEDAELPPVGARAVAEIDWPRRHRLMRMHTCLHLLSAVLPYPVTGGRVGEDRSRLDFDIPEPVDKERVGRDLNRLIDGDHPVRAEWITDAELTANPELVRTMSVRPPTGAGRVRLIRIEGLDLQPCGGTHVARTGEIGAVEVARIEKKGRQNRRVVVALK